MLSQCYSNTLSAAFVFLLTLSLAACDLPLHDDGAPDAKDRAITRDAIAGIHTAHDAPRIVVAH